MKFRNTDAIKVIIALLILLTALLLPRIFSLGRFVAVDEVNWLHRSATFYDAIVRKNWSGTYVSEHPGVITSWVGALAFKIAAPDYRVTSDAMVTSYTAFEEKLSRVVNLKPIFINIYILAVARAIMILLLIFVLLLCYLYAQSLFGILPSLIGFLLIALDPFFIALSRMNHLDAPQAVFMFLSILAFLKYLLRGNRWFDLVISGVAGGLAFLAKLPGIFIIPAIGLVALWNYFRARPVKKVDFSFFADKSLRKLVLILLVWLLVFMVAYTAFWHSMWVNPVETLKKVFNTSSNLASTIIEEDNIEQLPDANPSAARTLTDYLRYPITFLWRTTPVGLIGLFLLVIAWYLRKDDDRNESAIKSVQGLLIFAVIYTIGITLPTKSSEKYFAPVYLVLDLFAGLGWYYGVSLLAKGIQAVQRKYVFLAVTIAVIAIQSVWVYQSFPYYFTYYNPLLGGLRKAAQVKMIGVGEGLDMAGRYLTKNPHSSDLKVMSWYGIGPLSYFFDGYVDPVYMSNSAWTPDFIQRLKTMDYLVIYTNQKFRNQPPELFNILSQIAPEYTVTINGAEYAWIYKVSDIPGLEDGSGPNP